jgi:hypothetical protein
VAEHRDDRAERDHRERGERAHRRDHRRENEHHLVGRLRDHVFLERELEPVGKRLQQAEWPVAVGARPHLHPAEGPALVPVDEQRHHDQEREDQYHLDEHEPPRIPTELLQAGGLHR